MRGERWELIFIIGSLISFGLFADLFGDGSYSGVMKNDPCIDLDPVGSFDLSELFGYKI